ncbi:uncharacterized protein TNCV_3840481 [Trichonephila clavipes]|nr:uncharacterized protein TNCV_3840481 [Trichonephila clavipes]
MTSCNHMCCLSCNSSQEPIFNKTMLGLPRQGCHKTISTLLLPILGLPRSPDLSLIELICDHLGQRVKHRMSLNELEARLQQIWNEMSPDIIQNLHASMLSDRIVSCFRARRSSTG